ncbi:MAG TPA: hypothetical protein VIK77_02700 [Tissierellaceae bacterium]
MLSWDNKNTGGNEKIFNQGVAGECLATMTVESAKGKLGPNGNPLPDYVLYTIKFKDNANPDSRPLDVSINRINETTASGQPTKPAAISARLNFVAQVFRAALPGKELPELANTGDDVADANKAIVDAMEMVVAAGSKTVRVFAHFEKAGSPHAYLNVRQGFDGAGVLAVGSDEVFEPSKFMERPKADVQEQVPPSDLPF